MPKPSHRPLTAFGSFPTKEAAHASQHKLDGARHYPVKTAGGGFALRPKLSR